MKNAGPLVNDAILIQLILVFFGRGWGGGRGRVVADELGLNFSLNSKIICNANQAW
jgi:hypothetical protein